jgi:hypothetical protein
VQVSSEHGKERDKALVRLREHGWRDVGVNPKTGYTKLYCGCGDHVGWLPKTPSNRATYRRKADHLIGVCSCR